MTAFLLAISLLVNLILIGGVVVFTFAINAWGGGPR